MRLWKLRGGSIGCFGEDYRTRHQFATTRFGVWQVVLDILFVRHAKPHGLQEEEKVARLSVIGNGQVVAGNLPSGGLDVVFGGVEVFEVRASVPLGWRKVLAAAGLVALLMLSAGAWMRGSRGEMTTGQFQQGIVITGAAFLYAIWTLKQIGVVWRFDHKRKTITRRHWLRGLSRNWKSGEVTALRVLNGKNRLGTEVVQLGLMDKAGNLVAQVGCWEKEQVNLNQVEAVVGQIKTVMWWR
jgi:hypothetical protein